MIAPKIPLVQDGQILSTNLVNSMIGRIEYAADLLRQYKLIAGDEMYVEPHFDGTRVSYLQQVAGGATPAQPLVGALPPFFNPDGTQNATQNTIWMMDNMMLEDNPKMYDRIVEAFTKGVKFNYAAFAARFPGAQAIMNMKSSGGLMSGPNGNPPGFLVGEVRPIPQFSPYGRGGLVDGATNTLLAPPVFAPGFPVGIWMEAAYP
jgi:hypothetical protein